MSLPHITLQKTENELLLQIEDTEVFDFVDDFLVEQRGIECKTFTISEVNGVSVYTMHFSSEITEEEMKTVLSELSPTEIEKIFQINNPRQS